MEQAGILPATEEEIHKTVDTAEVPLSPSDRKLNGKLGVEDVGDVLLGRSVILVDISLIEIVAAREASAVSVTCIHGDRSPYVGGEACGNRVVVAAGNRLGDWNIAQLR